MTLKEQDAIAEVIRTQWGYNNTDYDGIPVGRNAVSRLAQSLADKLAYGYDADGKKIANKFDRERFVKKCGFGHLEQF
jgi:hypothetical protein